MWPDCFSFRRWGLWVGYRLFFALKRRGVRGYTAAVASKKGVTGIGLLKHLCDESRSTRKVCGFVIRAPSFGGSTGGRKPGRFSQEVPGSPTRRAAAFDWTRERRFQ
jgi:hypothetical protein